VSYPPGVPGGDEQQPSGQQQPQQGGWPGAGADPGATQPMQPPTADYPTAPPPMPDYQQQPQQPYYQPPQQDPYFQQQQQQYPYTQQTQPMQQYPYQYDPNAGGYGPPMAGPPAGSAAQSRNAMIAVLVAVAVVAIGVSVYWFGFHNTAKSTPVGLGSTLTGSPAPATTPAASTSPSPSPQDSSTGGSDVADLQALMATMSDPGCRAAFQSLITFEQASATDSGDDTALLTDYDTAISSLTAAQGQAQNQAAADAIGQVVSDWKQYTAQLAQGETPDDSTLTGDGEQLAAACLAS
jgi:hypothetical protein